jgi:hypothetical protein
LDELLLLHEWLLNELLNTAYLLSTSNANGLNGLNLVARLGYRSRNQEDHR